MSLDNKRIIIEEGVHLVADGNGELLAMLRRDPKSKKHLVYFLKEGNSADIADKLIKNDSALDKK